MVFGDFHETLKGRNKDSRPKFEIHRYRFSVFVENLKDSSPTFAVLVQRI